jgi:single-stranded DNA-binding protein
MTVSSVYVGVLADDPAREYTVNGAPVARFPLSCVVPPEAARYAGNVAVTVETDGELAELVLRDLRAGDRLLVVGDLAVSPPDPGRHGATDLYVRARHVGLDVTSTGWHRDHPMPPAAAVLEERTADPSVHW